MTAICVYAEMRKNDFCCSFDCGIILKESVRFRAATKQLTQKINCLEQENKKELQKKLKDWIEEATKKWKIKMR